MGLTDALTVGYYPDMNMMINTESPRLAVTPGESYASDLHATTSTGFPRRDVVPDVIGAVKLDCRTVWGFPQIDSAAVDCGAVALNELNFRRISFPPDEFSAGRECDYIWLAPLASSSVCARTVTGSLLFRSPHRLLGLSLDIRSEKLYNVAPDIPDVMGLRALCHRYRLNSRTGSHVAFRVRTYVVCVPSSTNQTRGGTPAPPPARSGTSLPCSAAYRESGECATSIYSRTPDCFSVTTTASPERSYQFGQGAAP